MTRQDVASLAFRIVGIVLLVQVLSWWVAVSGVWLSDDGWWSAIGLDKTWAVLISLLGEALALLVAGVLIFKNDVLAKRTFPDPGIPISLGGTSLPEWQSLALSVIGVYLVASALPEVPMAVYAFVLEFHMIEPTPPIQGYVPFSWREIIPVGMQLTVGLVLFLCSEQLSLLWQEVRRNRPVRSSVQRFAWIAIVFMAIIAFGFLTLSN